MIVVIHVIDKIHVAAAGVVIEIIIVNVIIHVNVVGSGNVVGEKTNGVLVVVRVCSRRAVSRHT